MHHLFSPHFFGPPFLPGIPNIILLIALAAAVGWMISRRKQPASGQDLSPKNGEQSGLENKNAELQAEVDRLKKENELLQALLRKELQSQK